MGGRSLLTLILILTSVFSHASMQRWSWSSLRAGHPILRQDPSGGIYLGTVETDLLGNRVRVRKFSTNGTLLKTMTLFDVGDDIVLQDLVVTNTEVLALVTVYREGSFYHSAFASVDMDSSFTSSYYAMPEFAVKMVSLDVNRVAFVGRTTWAPSGGRAVLTILDKYIGTSDSRLYGGDRSEFVSVLKDSSGAIIVGGTGYQGTDTFPAFMVLKAVVAGTTPTTVYERYLRASAAQRSMATDMALSTDGTYLLIGGYGQTSGEESLDSMIVRVLASTGLNPVYQFHARPDRAFDVQVEANAGGWVLVVGEDLYTEVIRIQSNMLIGWAVERTCFNSDSRTLAIDSEGNPVVNDLNGFTPVPRITKFDRLTGEALSLSIEESNAQVDPGGLCLDAAGNAYHAGTIYENSDSITFLRSYAFASLGAGASVTGGNSVPLTIQLASAAPSTGALFVLSSSGPDAVVPASVTVPAGATSASFPVTGLPVNTLQTTVIGARWKGTVLQRAFAVLPATASGVTLIPVSVLGGVNSSGIATLNGKAGNGGTIVTLTSSLPGAASVPTSVVVPTGTSSVGFTVTTSPQLTNKGITIWATTGVVTKSAFMAVNAPWLTTVAITPTTVKGGLPADLALSLNGPSPSGYSVNLVSGAPSIVVLPSSTAMIAGSASKTLTFTTQPVTTTITVTVLAYRGPYVRTATLTMTP